MAITPTAPGDPLFPFAPEREGQSVDVTTSGGARTSSYKVQFVPPGLVRYVMPGVRPRFLTPQALALCWAGVVSTTTFGFLWHL